MYGSGSHAYSYVASMHLRIRTTGLDAEKSYPPSTVHTSYEDGQVHAYVFCISLVKACAGYGRVLANNILTSQKLEARRMRLRSRGRVLAAYLECPNVSNSTRWQLAKQLTLLLRMTIHRKGVKLKSAVSMSLWRSANSHRECVANLSRLRYKAQRVMTPSRPAIRHTRY